jgi:hypothetical protein
MGAGISTVRRYAVFAAIAAVLVAAAIVVVLLVPKSSSPQASTAARASETAAVGASAAGTASATAPTALSPGGPVPTTADTIAQQFVAGSPAQQRAALSGAVALVLPTGTMFPAGSTLSLDADGWHQDGQYAAATGTLTEPGAAALRVQIGFTDVSGPWLVTYEAPLT